MKFDWTNFTRKLSTLVAALAVAMAGISTTLLGYYNDLSAAERAAWPWWVPLVLTLAPGLVAAMGPVAVAFKQAFFATPDDAGKADP